MFKGAISFNQPLNNWNTSNLDNTSEMFKGAISFNQDIRNWNLENIYWSKNMFLECPLEDRYKPIIPAHSLTGE